MINQPVIHETAKLAPDTFVVLFELDARLVGLSEVQYFYSGTTSNYRTISYKGRGYTALPVAITGISKNSEGAPERPRIRFGNLKGYMSSLTALYDDLVGATVIIRRIMRSGLDWNEPPGFPPEIFSIERLVSEDNSIVEFELRSQMDLEGLEYPVRTVVADYCSATYRDGITCPYVEPKAVADRENNPLNGTLLTASDEYDITQAYDKGDSVWKDFTLYNKTKLDNEGVAQPLVIRAIFQAKIDVLPGIEPPNSIYWTQDSCRQDITGCRYRFDVKDGAEWAGKSLPGYMMPGAGTLPL